MRNDFETTGLPPVIVRAAYGLLNNTESVCMRNNGRKHNWRDVRCCIGSILPGQFETREIKYKGKWSKYKGCEYTPLVQSVAYISPCHRHVKYIFGNGNDRKVIVRTAPKGMFFADDKNGLFIYRTVRGKTQDLHLNGADLQRKNFASYTLSQMIQLRQSKGRAVRMAKEQKRNDAIREREIGTCRVTLLDSRNAGNCIEGSLRFAESRLGMTRDTILSAPWLVHVPAYRLLSTGDILARNAAISAWHRETMVCI